MSQFIISYSSFKILLLNLLFLNSAVVCSWHPLHLNLEDIFLYHFVLVSFTFHPPATNPANPLLYFLTVQEILPKLNLIPRYSINGHFPNVVGLSYSVCWRHCISLSLSLLFLSSYSLVTSPSEMLIRYFTAPLLAP